MNLQNQNIIFPIFPLPGQSRQQFLASLQQHIEKPRLITGQDYIPPLNAIPFAHVPIQSSSNMMQQIQTSPLFQFNPTVATSIPEHFSWRNSTQQPQNQLGCGGCWSFAGTECIADRFVIQKGVSPPIVLSATYPLTCLNSNQAMGCGGGDPIEVFNLASQVGIPINQCLTYGWCIDNNGCNIEAAKHFQMNPQQLNQLMPQCDSVKGCKDIVYFTTLGNTVSHYGINPLQEDSTPDLVNSKINLIKSIIKTKGPLVSGFAVYGDFIIPSSKPALDHFAQAIPNIHQIYNYGTTNGIYINGAYDALFDKYSITIPDKDGQPNLPGKALMGFHAVVIVGWGVDEVTLPNKDKPQKIEYWIIRNSWGTEWNDAGYFKAAIYNPDVLLQNQPLNASVGFDCVVSSFGGAIGGLAGVDVHDAHDINGHSVLQSLIGRSVGNGEEVNSSIEKYWWLMAISLIIILGAVVGWWYYNRRRREE